MNREKQLEFCKICKHKKLDLKKGILCALTNEPAQFEESCESFEENADLKLIEEVKKKEEIVLGNAAGHGLRLTNYLIDLVCLFIFVIIFTVILNSINPGMEGSVQSSNKLVDYLIGFIAGMCYYFIFEATTGRTIGKFITGTRVVTETGEIPGPKDIFIRSLCRHIPFDAFSFLGSDASGWHDSISNTCVVKTK